MPLPLNRIDAIVNAEYYEQNRARARAAFRENFAVKNVLRPIARIVKVSAIVVGLLFAGGICLLIPIFGWIALICGAIWLMSKFDGDGRPMTTTEAFLVGFIIGRHR